MKPLIILDINGTLCLSQHKTVPGVQYDAKARTKFIYKRPYLRDFLNFLFNHFRVAVWSSNNPQNAQAAVEALFTLPQQRALLFVWGRDKCETTDYDHSSVKNLQKIDYPLGGVTIIDDTPEKIVGTHFYHNHLAIKPYLQPDETDTGLQNAAKWLIETYRVQM